MMTCHGYAIRHSHRASSSFERLACFQVFYLVSTLGKHTHHTAHNIYTYASQLANTPTTLRTYTWHHSWLRVVHCEFYAHLHVYCVYYQYQRQICIINLIVIGNVPITMQLDIASQGNNNVINIERYCFGMIEGWVGFEERCL